MIGSHHRCRHDGEEKLMDPKKSQKAGGVTFTRAAGFGSGGRPAPGAGHPDTGEV
jgi:hypothetical protein